MALPLLPLPSSLALEDDDELQESTEGRIKNLLGLGKRSARTNAPREDYDDKKWKAAARNVAITKLPAAFGGRMLRFQKEPIPGSKVKTYTLRVGVAGEDTEAQYMLVVRPDTSGRFRAKYRKIQPGDVTVDDEFLWQVVYSTNITDENKIEYYEIYPTHKKALAAHQSVKYIVGTVVKFVEPRANRKAPNDFERVYDDDSDKRALAKFLLGKHT